MDASPHSRDRSLGWRRGTGAAAGPAGNLERRASLLAVVAALFVHGAAALFVANLDAVPPTFVEPLVVELAGTPAAPPPTPPPPVAPSPALPAIPVQRRPILDRTARPAPLAESSPVPPPASEPPPQPQPNQEAPAAATPSARPLFGVTMNSVIADEGGAPSVPVGNTLMGNGSSKPGDKPIGVPASGNGTGSFAPVADVYIAARAQLVHEVDSESVYPSQAKALGIEGTVETILDIDDRGTVVGVKLTRRAGHGFDEAASRALKQFRFKPARTNDGRAVPCRIGWKYTFVVND